MIKFPRQVVGKAGGVMAMRERRGAVDDDGEKDAHTNTTATADDVLKTR